MRLAALLAATLLAAAPADANDAVEFSSGERQVVLLELYTSEGCSSCPPADRWLSGLKADAGLWVDVVPVAFHVDYWNYLGWRDRFSDDRYSDRQRRYRHEGAAGAVYTPGFFAGGAEWLGWRGGRKPEASPAEVGPLRVTIRGDRVEIRFEPAAAGNGKLSAHVALLGMNRNTAVLRGENRGRRLTHDFVVLEHASAAMRPQAEGFEAILVIDRPDASELGVAVWVEDARRQQPLQATGGFLSAPPGPDHSGGGKSHGVLTCRSVAVRLVAVPRMATAARRSFGTASVRTRIKARRQYGHPVLSLRRYERDRLHAGCLRRPR